MKIPTFPTVGAFLFLAALYMTAFPNNYYGQAL